MNGLVTKRHVLLVARHLGWRAALRLLLTQQPVALAVIMKGV